MALSRTPQSWGHNWTPLTEGVADLRWCLREGSVPARDIFPHLSCSQSSRTHFSMATQPKPCKSRMKPAPAPFSSGSPRLVDSVRFRLCWERPTECLGEEEMETWDWALLQLPWFSDFSRSFSAFSFSISLCRRQSDVRRHSENTILRQQHKKPKNK